MNFQNNFGTNLTSNTTAGATTSPINSMPTVDAPYYLAFDATNLNSHYEVVLVTSDTATNVNHAATTYDHDTSEEVRMIVPAGHLNAHEGLSEGQMLNGNIVPSVASNNLTVALKTNAGTDPSTTDPVYAMIGGTLRTITSALSKTINAAANSFNAGSSELATKEIDYPTYLSYNATDGVVIGVSRYFGNIYSDFSATATNEKAMIYSGSNAAASDSFVVIGRFAATLSAGAGYTWSVPTFTASNLIQRPIYETRWLSYVPRIYGAAGSAGTYAATIYGDTYKIVGNSCILNVALKMTNAGSWSSNTVLKLPFLFAGASNSNPFSGEIFTGVTAKAYAIGKVSDDVHFTNSWASSYYTSFTANDLFKVSGTYEI